MFSDVKYQITSDRERTFFVQARYHMHNMGRDDHDYYNASCINNLVNLPIFVYSSPDG